MGIVGTGTGPEFTDPSYSDRGVYSAEMIPIKYIINGKVNMVPETIKEEFISYVESLDKDVTRSISKSENLRCSVIFFLSDKVLAILKMKFTKY